MVAIEKLISKVYGNVKLLFFIYLFIFISRCWDGSYIKNGIRNLLGFCQPGIRASGC